MPSLNILIKPASGNCNMTCDYCFYCDEMSKREHSSYGFMSEETLKNVIRKTMPYSDYQITYAFQGGEPTLCGIDFFKKVLDYEKQYNHRGLIVNNALQTNGLGLNEEWCRFFKDNHFLIGVSVDGIRSIHDFYRHQRSDHSSTYDQILHNIQLLDRFQVDYNILTVVTETVAQHAREIYTDYKKRAWFYQQYIECLDPIDETFNQKSYSLQPLTYGKFLTELFDLWYSDYQQSRNVYIRKFDNYISILAGRMPESCEQRGCCGIQIVVEADGSAYPCDFYVLDAYKLGNFNTDRLQSMDDWRKEIRFVEKSMEIPESCRKCRYYFLCRGGCQRSRDYIDELHAYQNHFCAGYQYFFDHCLERMQKIASTYHRAF